MRGNDIHSRAAKRIRNDHRQRALDQFDHRILADGVHDDIVEDDQLAHLEDAIAKLEDTRDRRRGELPSDDSDPGAGIADSLDGLQETARERVMEICAERARSVLDDGDDWVAAGYEDAEDVEEAQQEAATWLVANAEATRRVFGGTDVLREQEVDA
ncbi:hypothetical protein V9T20_12525 (plasmid) [Halobacterium salinarum]|uniref:hypothetical protein n=1 Tax=Halobacterium salinarum TaxID=2242 RepID=UPI0030CE471C